VIDLDPLSDKWRSFGWSVHEIEGHNLTMIEQALKEVPYEPNRPSCIIAHTVKGKGISFMEDKLLWHYKAPLGEEFDMALAELEKNK
jgi:transketolase